MTRRETAATVVLISLLLHPLLAVAGQGGEKVTIGIVDDTTQAARYEPLLAHLNGSPDYEFEIVLLDTIDELYDDFKSNTLRLAVIGSVFYAKARHELGVVPLVKDRPATSTIVTRTGSPIQSLADLRGRRLALGYPDSTTSNLIPRMALWQVDIKDDDLTDDAAAFARNRQLVFFAYTGSHAAVVEEVLAGRFDAGAVVDAVFADNTERGLRAIFTSEPYPGVPLVCHKEESEAFTAAVRELFLSYRAPDPAAGSHFCKGATAASDRDYSSVRYLSNVVLGTHYPLD